MHRALILVDGDPPPVDLLRRAAASADWFACADGALAVALTSGIAPHAVIGDMDSLAARGIAVPRGIECLPVSDQETTDLEKALLEALARGATHARVLGIAGRRLDHVHAHFSLFARFAGRLTLSAEDAFGRLDVLATGVWHALGLPVGARVSLLALPEAEHVVTEGLRWPLDGATLTLGTREAHGNELTRSDARVSYAGGCLALYVPHGG